MNAEPKVRLKLDKDLTAAFDDASARNDYDYLGFILQVQMLRYLSAMHTSISRIEARTTGVASVRKDP